MPDREWNDETWDNTTYYDDKGLQYLVERLHRSVSGIGKGSAVYRSEFDRVDAVQVRYYGGKKGYASAKLKRGVSGGLMLTLRIARKTKLFESDLEKLAGLSGEEPKIPEAALIGICSALMENMSNRWRLREALRAEYPEVEEEARGYGFPPKKATHHVKAHVLPMLDVPIHEKAKPGSAAILRVSSLGEKIERYERRIRWAAGDIERTEKALRNMKLGLHSDRVKLAKARADLAALKEGE